MQSLLSIQASSSVAQISSTTIDTRAATALYVPAPAARAPLDHFAVDDAVCVQASYVASRRYAVIDIGTAPCPIRSGGSVGGEEGVVAEITLPMLRQAVALPEGTQAAAEIIGGTWYPLFLQCCSHQNLLCALFRYTVR